MVTWRYSVIVRPGLGDRFTVAGGGGRRAVRWLGVKKCNYGVTKCYCDERNRFVDWNVLEPQI